jgi:hypothetical protein
MTRPGSEPWVCGSCRSFNEVRSTRCYKCHTPRLLAEADLSTLIVAGAGATEASAAVTEAATAAVLGGYRGSSVRAGIVQCMLVATGIVTVVVSVAGAEVISRLLAGDREYARREIGAVNDLAWVQYGFFGVTLLCWAAWLSRVVDNIPKVGLGWPNVSPTAAFIENFLPGWNLLRIPSILRDVLHRLERTGGRGDMLLAAGWLGLAGGTVLPPAFGLVLGFFVSSMLQAVSLGVVLNQVGLGLKLVGALALILLIRRIESGMAAAAATVDTSIKERAAAELAA